MIRYLFNYAVVPFWASRNHTMFELLRASGFRWQGRVASQALTPGFPRFDMPAEPPPQYVRPIPTDVPIPEPMDVPVPEPHDIPVQDPGGVPKPAMPRPDETNPKPRSVP